MKRNTTLAIILAPLVLVAALLPAMAQQQAPEPPAPPSPGGPPPGPPPPPGMGMLHRLIHGLELSPDQAEQVEKIVSDSMEGELGPQHQAFGEARRTLESLTWNPGVTEQELIGASQAVSAEAEHLAVLQFRMAQEIHAVLTEAQRERLQELFNEPPPDPWRPGGGPGKGFGPRRHHDGPHSGR